MPGEIFPSKAQVQYVLLQENCNVVENAENLCLSLFSGVHSSLGSEEARAPNLLTLLQVFLGGRPPHLQPKMG